MIRADSFHERIKNDVAQETAMNIQQLENNMAANLRNAGNDLANDLKAECAHIADPVQCGSIVRRHFDGIVIGIYVFIGLFLTAAMVAICMFTLT